MLSSAEMTTKTTIRHELPIDEDTYWTKLFHDEGYTRRLYVEALGFRKYEPIRKEKEADGDVVRRYAMEPPTELPGVIRKIAGDPSYVEEGRWSAKDRVYRFTITPKAMPEKVRINGTLRIEKRGEKKIERVIELEIEAKMFGVGGVLESFIEKTNRENWDKNAVFSRKYIAENGL